MRELLEFVVFMSVTVTVLKFIEPERGLCWKLK
jgi:hypothetical protein